MLTEEQPTVKDSSVLCVISLPPKIRALYPPDPLTSLFDFCRSVLPPPMNVGGGFVMKGNSNASPRKSQNRILSNAASRCESDRPVSRINEHVCAIPPPRSLRGRWQGTGPPSAIPQRTT